LHGHDFHDFVLQSVAQEVVNNLVFLDGQSEQVDFLKRFDFAITNKAAKFGNWLPDLLLTVTIATSSASTTASATTLSITATTSVTSAASTATTSATSTKSSAKITTVS
jgi:hypothetical protein